jgi:hypothetical protein
MKVIIAENVRSPIQDNTNVNPYKILGSSNMEEIEISFNIIKKF